MTTPLATLAAQVTAAGVTAPSYTEILESLQASFKLIYGDDAYFGPDSQDGQLLAIFARAIHDCNQAVIAAYNSFSPQTAVGVGLSNVVKINHMERLPATKSQVNVTLVGQAGVTIVNGIVGDNDGNKWDLPSSVTIPISGTITVTAQAQESGNIGAPIGAVTRILTPVAGWQSVTNSVAGTPGLPVESDAALRARQEITPAINSNTVLVSLAANLKALPGVVYGVVYENDTDTTDANGVPGHSIACVVRGGDTQQIAETIYAKKAPGVATYGTTTVEVTDVSGAPRDINFFIPTEIDLEVTVAITAGVGYTTATGQKIKEAIVKHITALDIGESVVVNRLFAAALLYGAPESETYVITSIQACELGGTLGTADIPIAFTSKAIISIDDVTLTVS